MSSRRLTGLCFSAECSADGRRGRRPRRRATDLARCLAMDSRITVWSGGRTIIWRQLSCVVASPKQRQIIKVGSRPNLRSLLGPIHTIQKELSVAPRNDGSLKARTNGTTRRHSTDIHSRTHAAPRDGEPILLRRSRPDVAAAAHPARGYGCAV